MTATIMHHQYLWQAATTTTIIFLLTTTKAQDLEKKKTSKSRIFEQQQMCNCHSNGNNKLQRKLLSVSRWVCVCERVQAAVTNNMRPEATITLGPGTRTTATRKTLWNCDLFTLIVKKYFCQHSVDYLTARAGDWGTVGLKKCF